MVKSIFQKKQYKQRLIFVWLISMCIGIALFFNDSFAEQGVSPHRILFINSYHRGFLWSDGIEDGIQETLKSYKQPVDLYIEYLDTRRFPDSNYLSSVAEMFISKHSKTVYDAVIVSDNPAFDFAVKYREKIFPNSPIIFCGYNSFRPEIIKDMTNISGVNEEIDFSGTIEMALAVHPKTKKLVFVTTDHYSTGKQNQEAVEKTLIPTYQNRYQIQQIKNLYLQEIKKELANLNPNDTLVFIFGTPIDSRNNKSMKIEEYYKQQAIASAAPTYSFWDFTLNTGIMGGNIITGLDQGRAATELVLKILNGEPIDQIPVIMDVATKKIFDFNAMTRFNISESALPINSVIINKPDNFYQRYKTYIWVIIGTIIILLSFLTILFAYSRHLGFHLQLETNERRKAEEALKLHYNELEQIIAERTAEIERMNASLREREALFHGMFETHSAIMFLVSPETGEIFEANQSSVNFYGYTIDKLKSLKIYDLNQLTREEIDYEINLARTEKRKYFLFRHRLSNGEIRDVEVHSTPIIWQQHNLLFSIVHDITQRKLTDEALKNRERELKELNATKDQLFSIIAHDLRNPFNAILSFSEHLLENIETISVEESREFIKDIHFAANSTFKLLNNLLDWARTQTNQVKIFLEKIDISININDVLRDLSAVASNKNITLRYINPRETFVYADQNMFNTILRNLISNSIKYTPLGGTIKVETKIKGDFIQFSVSDNGIGMTKEIQNQLFISNVNHSTHGTNNEKGTGLGLVICQAFVKKLDGNIWVESEVGKGSIFIFTLPSAS